MNDLTLPEVIRWRLIDVHQGRTSCQHCGHAIKNIFTLLATNGRRIEVGSDCVMQLLDPSDQSDAKLINRRTTRAAKQWREQNPKARTDETREQYIARRIVEMSHAVAAFKVSMALDWYKTATKMAREKGVPVDLNAAYNELHIAIEQKYQANRYDYNRPIWQVRKV